VNGLTRRIFFMESPVKAVSTKLIPNKPTNKHEIFKEYFCLTKFSKKPSRQPQLKNQYRSALIDNEPSQVIFQSVFFQPSSQ